ncbi:hypothetical protein BD560DRAFT_340917 [Blakeslea trispora]|nr:hypothetical protein BD560DRAFT_340917 [Blakeslea trispora]
MSKPKPKLLNHSQRPKSIQDTTDRITSSDQDSEDDIIQCICSDSSDDGFTIQCEQCEKWQHAECVKIKKNRIPDHYICSHCMKKSSDRNHQHHRRKSSIETGKKKQHTPLSLAYSSSSEDSEPDTPSRKKQTRLNKCIVKEEVVLDLFKEIQRQWMELYRSSTKPTMSPTSQRGLESIVVMESDLLLPVIPRATVKPLRKNLLRPSHNMTKGLFADTHIPEHRYLMEITGELIRKSVYRTNPVNQYSLLGTPLPHVFFYHAFDICIDARSMGNDSRYVRRSCSPNAEVKSIILPHNSHDQTIHLGIYTQEEVERGEEITIGWNWGRKAMMYQKNQDFFRNNNYQVDIMPEERETLREVIELITAKFGDCACTDKSECLIAYLKDELQINMAKNTKKRKRPVVYQKKTAIFSSDEEKDHKEQNNMIKEAIPMHHQPPKKRWLQQHLYFQAHLRPGKRN